MVHLNKNLHNILKILFTINFYIINVIYILIYFFSFIEVVFFIFKQTCEAHV